MDREVAETLAYFRENVSELKKLGKGWGLSDSEIDYCIQQAMAVDDTQLVESEAVVSYSSARVKFAARKTWSKVRVGLVVAGVLVALCCAAAMAMQNDVISHRVDQMIHPYMHPIFRMLRLMAVPLHAYPFTYDWYLEECFVDNPFFSGGDKGPDFCKKCQSIEKVAEYMNESLDNSPLPSSAFMEPLLFRGYGSIVNLKRLQETLSPNPLSWKPMHGIKTNLEWAPQVKDLLRPDAEELLRHRPNFYFHWISKLTSTSQLLRKVFPRPEILKGKEVSLRKILYFGGPSSGSYDLTPSFMFPNSWYVQGWGSRKLVLTPAKECTGRCQQISVSLHAGDLLTYNVDVYSVEVFPVGDEIIIGFLSHFNPL